MAPALKVPKLTRRSAIGGLVSALSCPALAGLRGEPDFDVLIIGAGAAGIAAGRRLLASNKKFAAQSGHHAAEFQCLLLGVKRTSGGRSSMPAFDPKRTFGPEDCCFAK